MTSPCSAFGVADKPLPFAQLDTSQILINRIFPMGSGSAVDFFALFPDDDAAESFNNAINGAVRCDFPSPTMLTSLRRPAAASRGVRVDADAEQPAAGDARLIRRLIFHPAGCASLFSSSRTSYFCADAFIFAAPAPRASAGTTVTATGGGGGVGTGGSGGSASGEGATPGSPGYGTPGAPGTVTTSGGR